MNTKKRRALDMAVTHGSDDEDDSSSETEIVDLISRGKGRTISSTAYPPEKPRLPRWVMLVAVTLCIFGGLYVSYRNGNTADAFETTVSDHNILRYACPSEQRVAENVATAKKEHEKWYDSVSQRIQATNVSEYLQTFRETACFDNWGHSYTEVKDGMFDWKSKRFAELKDGDLLYESASGIGLNLYMTLEIMQEVSDVKDIVVYGNEFVRESVAISRAIAGGTSDHSSSFLPAGGKLGTICAADSTQLDFVPARTFDVVFCGYISPLFNPLGYNGTTDENFRKYSADCEEHPEVAAKAQKRQNEWYAAWVGEMIRIAKPGAPIIVEQVSYPLCGAIFDWGGVNRAFWKDAVQKYNWDVDRSSVEMDADTIFRKRYHVFMRKKGAKKQKGQP